MQDGVAWLTYNNQGGPRGGDEAGSQNWWMGMLSRPASGGTLQFNLQPTHGDRPTSFHLFVRVRPPAPMGRMVEMVMTKVGH